MLVFDFGLDLGVADVVVRMRQDVNRGFARRFKGYGPGRHGLPGIIDRQGQRSRGLHSRNGIGERMRAKCEFEGPGFQPFRPHNHVRRGGIRVIQRHLEWLYLSFGTALDHGNGLGVDLNPSREGLGFSSTKKAIPEPPTAL